MGQNDTLGLMTETTERAENFLKNLPEGFAVPEDSIGRRLLAEYGAAFVTRAAAPDAVIYRDAGEVKRFQESVEKADAVMGGIKLTLQTAAMRALMDAVDEAEKAGLAIKPRGTDSAGRSYQNTVDLWASRVEPSLRHWVAEGKLAAEEAERVRGLEPFEQVAVIFALESRGLWFAKDLSKSIIYSVAPPGASQHLSLLAIDIAEHGDELVRKIMNANGWFQTVVSDLPHFTFLGADESELPGLGLKRVVHADREYWLPDI
jgi:hypothetical protein